MSGRRRSARCRRWGVGLVAIGSFLLVLSACGDDGDANASDTSTTTTQSTTTTTQAATPGSATAESTTTEPSPTGAVEVFFSVGDGSDCGQVAGFVRPVDDGNQVLAGALEKLLSGPTADEVAQGADSFFGVATTDGLGMVSIGNGLAMVDFEGLDQLIPNASTSCGSDALLAQLNATVLQFDEVERVRYQLDGSCDRFAGWLQRECFEVTRSGELVLVSLIERATGSGCAPGTTDSLPDGFWFGYVGDATTNQLTFDLACWFAGEPAVEAAAEDGAESPPPNDYHIRNDSEQIRTLAVDSAAAVSWMSNPGDPASTAAINYDAWVAEQPGRVYRPGVWLTVMGGTVIGIEEQYQP